MRREDRIYSFALEIHCPECGAEVQNVVLTQPIEYWPYNGYQTYWVDRADIGTAKLSCGCTLSLNPFRAYAEAYFKELNEN